MRVENRFKFITKLRKNNIWRLYAFYKHSLIPTWFKYVVGVQKGDQKSLEQPEIIFIGTGTSEGIPRVSCLTHPLKKCSVIIRTIPSFFFLSITSISSVNGFQVCSQAVEPGNKNKRLNTSILIRYPRPSGTCNILIDAGKYVIYLLSSLI